MQCAILLFSQDLLAASDKLTNEQSYMVYGITGGIALFVFILMVIIICSLMTIRRRLRHQFKVQRQKATSGHSAEHSLHTENDKILLQDMEKRMRSDDFNSESVIKNESVSNF